MAKTRTDECSPPGIEKTIIEPAGDRQEYLIEHYRPGVTVEEFRKWATLVRESAHEMEREGKLVRYLRSTIVPADDALLCVLEAASDAQVRETYARADIAYDRISATITTDEGADPSDDNEGRGHETTALKPVSSRPPPWHPPSGGSSASKATQPNATKPKPPTRRAPSDRTTTATGEIK